uniref:Uncharacterized protein n=1 Tax=Anopheles dirus TaxID=7168 RepID=A0A182NQ38_9DIPT
MRTLKSEQYWKGCEFQYFLHYGGIVILRDIISTYPFEDSLKTIKGSLRSGWRCLHQAANRISELNDFELYNGSSNHQYPV